MERISRIVGGFALIILGIFLLVLPGPGILTILGGIALLSSEFAWAKGIADWAKEKAALLKREKERPSDDGSDDQTG